MIRAGALTYAVFISVVSAILCTMMILLVFLNRSFFIRIDNAEQTRENAASGVAYGMAIPDIDNNTYIDLYGEGSDSVRVKKRPWGAYELISSEASRSKYRHRKVALIGHRSPELNDMGLYLADRNRPLQISGNALLKGTCYLPKKGVDRAYIEGSNYSRERMVYGSIENSKNAIPKTEYDLKAYWRSYLEKEFRPYDSVVDFSSLPRVLSHPFHKKTVIAYSRKPIDLSGYQLSGNIMILSEASMNVDGSCKLGDVVLLAPRIRIDGLRRSRLQAIATDSLLVGERVQLLYPSSLLSVGKEKPYLKIGKETDIRGCVLSYQDQLIRRSNDLQIEIEENATISGMVYCQGNLELNGIVQGTVISNSFLLKTASGIYENHLLNGQIDREKMDTAFAGPSIETWNNKADVIEWL